MFKKSSNQALAKIYTHFSSLKAHLTKQPLTLPLIVLAIGISLTGYGLIKNLKSNNQSASAEQLPGTPESGAKSRITELYDALVAQNKGSDTDVSGLTAAPGDWGAKWNRIKTAALKGSSGGGGSGLPVFSSSSNPDVNFIDNSTGLEWSNPVYREGNQVKANAKEVQVSDDHTFGTKYNWSWDNSGSNNVAVGRKTASQVCQALGDNWRLPYMEELMNIRGFAPVKFSSYYKWSASISGSQGSLVYMMPSSQYSHTSSALNSLAWIMCVR